MKLKQAYVILFLIVTCTFSFSQEQNLTPVQQQTFEELTKVSNEISALIEKAGNNLFNCLSQELVHESILEAKTLLDNYLEYYRVNSNSPKYPDGFYSFIEHNFKDKFRNAIDETLKQEKLSLELCSFTGPNKTFKSEDELKIVMELYYGYEQQIDYIKYLKEQHSYSHQVMSDFVNKDEKLSCNEITEFIGLANHIDEYMVQLDDFLVEINESFKKLPLEQQVVIITNEYELKVKLFEKFEGLIKETFEFKTNSFRENIDEVGLKLGCD